MMSRAPGYVKLHRSLLDWEWWDDHSATRVLTYLMLSVNWQQKQWMGMTIEPGSIVTSYAIIAKSCGITEKQARRSMKVLELGSVIERKRAGKGQLVTLGNWDKYQSDEPQEGRQRAGKRAAKGQAKGSERATTKEGKEIQEGEEGKNSTNVEGQAPSSSKVDNRNPGVQAVIDHLTARLIELDIAKSLDGTQQANRFDASSLLKKLAKERPEFDPLESAKALIDFATGHEFHSRNTTRVGYLLRNLAKIRADAMAKRTNAKHQTNDEYAAAARRSVETLIAARENNAG